MSISLQSHRYFYWEPLQPLCRNLYQAERFSHQLGEPLEPDGLGDVQGG